MKKEIWGGTTICKNITPENAYFSQNEPCKRVNLMGTKQIGEAPQFVKKITPKNGDFSQNEPQP